MKESFVGWKLNKSLVLEEYYSADDTNDDDIIERIKILGSPDLPDGFKFIIRDGDIYFVVDTDFEHSAEFARSLGAENDIGILGF